MCQIPNFPSKFQNQFCNYRPDLTFPHSFRPLLLHQKHDTMPYSSIHPFAFESWFQEYIWHCLHSMFWWPRAPNPRSVVPRFWQHYSRNSSYSASRGHWWNRGRFLFAGNGRIISIIGQLSINDSFHFWLFLTLSGEVDCRFFITYKLPLIPYYEEIVGLSIKTGEGAGLDLTYIPV